MSKITQCIEKLLSYATEKLCLCPEDITYARNRLLSALGLDSPDEKLSPVAYGALQGDILDPILNYALDHKLCTREGMIDFEANLMTLVAPLPSVVNARFDDTVVDSGIESAEKWLFQLETDLNYIRKVDIDKNLYWTHNGALGEIGITINLSKPEKDPKEIERLKSMPSTGYPKCMLCPENVGFAGNPKHPSRATLRTIPIELNGESWYFQFSPYCYFDQHIIALSDVHRPMAVDRNCLSRLLDFVDIFPNYFIGSNAALPIVGGSILAHDHYQGGKKVMPLFDRKSRTDLFIDKFPSVKVCIVDWYNSVVRVSGLNRASVLDAATYVMDKWKGYSDESVGILAFTGDTPHNAVTPIARREEKEYIVDLILRNNRTDEKYPFGIFHPSEDLHNIKKEGIGLIEAMGLFILPGRLSHEAEVMKDYLVGNIPFVIKDLADPSNPMSKHLAMIGQLMIDKQGKMDTEDAEQAITGYINQACERILECTAVFKNTTVGQTAFLKFLLVSGINVLEAHLDEKPIAETLQTLSERAETLVPEQPVAKSGKATSARYAREQENLHKKAKKEQNAAATAEAQPTADADATTDTAAPQKRGRGRPRKS